MKKTEKGITIIALVLTIIVLLILAGVTIATVFGEDGLIAKVQLAKEKTEEANKKEQGLLNNLEAELIEATKKEFNEEKGVNSPRLSKGMIPIKYNGSNWVITTKEDPEWYDYQNKKWANIMLSDGTYKEDSPVGTIVSDNQLGSMFVWIPRYSYNFRAYAIPKNNEGQDNDPITDVTFLVGATNRDRTGQAYNLDYNIEQVEKGEASPKIVHPGFQFDGKNTTGMWVAKFEASMKEHNDNTIENNNVTDKTIKIIPNMQSWRHIQIGNCFANSLMMNKEGNNYGIEKTTTDSHLMKNGEWGAVSYLAASQYGIVPMGNTSSYVTGQGDYKTNIKQSTTGNITGIYDLNGGSWEYLSCYYENEVPESTTYGTSMYFENNKVKQEYEKYWDIYAVSQEEKTEIQNNLMAKDITANPIRKKISQNRWNEYKSHKGIGIYEVTEGSSYYGKLNNQSYSWMIDDTSEETQFKTGYYNDDYILIGYGQQCFLRRGGRTLSGKYAGIFSSSDEVGKPISDGSFRPVLLSL